MASFQVFWAIVPAGTRDRYAAGYDGNRFDSEAEAAAAIPELIEAIGCVAPEHGDAEDAPDAEDGGGWTVIAVCDGCGGDPEYAGPVARHRSCVERAAAWGAEDGAEDTAWIDDGSGTGPEGPIAYTAETLRRAIDSTRSWNEAACNAGALDLAHSEARGCADNVREAYYLAYGRAAEAAAREYLADLVAEAAEAAEAEVVS